MPQMKGMDARETPYLIYMYALYKIIKELDVYDDLSSDQAKGRFTKTLSMKHPMN